MDTADAVYEALTLAAKDLRRDMDERAARRVEDFARQHMIIRYPEWKDQEALRSDLPEPRAGWQPTAKDIAAARTKVELARHGGYEVEPWIEKLAKMMTGRRFDDS